MHDSAWCRWENVAYHRQSSSEAAQYWTRICGATPPGLLTATRRGFCMAIMAVHLLSSKRISMSPTSADNFS